MTSDLNKLPSELYKGSPRADWSTVTHASDSGDSNLRSTEVSIRF